MTESAKVCDNTSVGMIVRNQHGHIAVIERRNFPLAYALPAGHCDGDSYPQAAIREAKEEIGVEAISQEKTWGGTFSNPCRRQGGSHHDWQIFEVKEWHGTPSAGSDARTLIWLPENSILSLARRTASISKKYWQTGQSHLELTRHLASDPEWQNYPGLELVWCNILTMIGILNIED